MTPVLQESYRREQANYQVYAPGGPKAHLAESWFDPGGDAISVDHWRHRRLYACLNPLLRSHPHARWLTVGDGRCANDAQYLKRAGVCVVASDLCDLLLIEAKRRGLIDEYRVENAENLSCPDESFDWVLCNEAYHHFPRPMIALYEMLRVARLGVVLIEPFDRFLCPPWPETAWNWIKSLPARLTFRHRPDVPFRFEPAGNFIYTISRREIQKAAMALDLPCLAFLGMNDCYVQGVETEPAVADNPMFQRVRQRIGQLDRLCRWRIRQPQLLAAVIFKQMPADTALEELRKDGFDIDRLPPNPYRTGVAK